jgi:hypothetical protein
MVEWKQQHEVQLQREAQRRLELQQQQVSFWSGKISSWGNNATPCAEGMACT